MSRKNPNSSIRRGYEFEDLHVLQLCVDWLCEPEKFRGIKVQYVPDGTSGFSIDDVVVEFQDGRHSFFQLKHKQNPSYDLWDFEHLLEKGMLRWIASYEMVVDNPLNKCSLITNGSAAPDVQSCRAGHKIELAKINELYPEIAAKLRDNFSESVLSQFFLGFDFVFSHPERHELEKKIRSKLYDELKVTKAGVDSLLLYIGTEGSEQYPKMITLADIRNHLSWDNPRPLNQNFQIPADFEFFDKISHQHVLHDLRNSKGGTKVFVGNPGAGKSTYLSKLYKILVRDKVAVFRHHYHLNPKDDSQFERLNADRVKEALRAAFKKQTSDVLEELSWENTEFTPLREFICKISTYYSERGKSFVLIIDGLDHVLREGNSEAELQDFIGQVFYPQAGYWLLLGTQEMAMNSLPNSLLRLCPRDSWIEIKGLSRGNVAKIVRSATKALKMNIDHQGDKEFINKIYEITSGNPLHLRYVLGELVSSSGRLLLNDLERIAPYKGDIKLYYQDIWRDITGLAKTFCFAITTLDFKLHKEQLIQLGSYLARYPSEISQCLNEIKHLLNFGLAGITVYHNSFIVFMKEQPELTEQKFLLYKSIKTWLTENGDHDLKWSELAKIEYYLGNSALLLSIDKEWIVKSYLQCKDEQQIQNLLDLATEAAFKAGDYKKSIFFGEMSMRYGRRSYALWDDNLGKIWVTSFRTNPNIFIKYPDFSKLTHYQLKELLIALKDRGMITEIPPEAIDRINLLFQDQNISSQGIAEDWIEVLLNFDNTGGRRVTDFLKQFKAEGRSGHFYGYYVRKIVEKYDKFGDLLARLLKAKLNEQEKRSIGDVLVQEDLKNGLFYWKEWLNDFQIHTNYNSGIYQFLGDHIVPATLTLRKRDEFQDEYRYGSSEDNPNGHYTDHFYTALFLSLAQRTGQIQEWMKTNRSDKQTQLLKAILQIGQKLAFGYNRKIHISICDIIAPLDSIENLDFYKDHSLYELRRSTVPQIIDHVLWLTNVFNKHNGFNTSIQTDEVKKLLEHSWYYKSHLFDLLHDRKVTISPDAFVFFTQHELEKLSNEMIEFKDKTERMANLALLAYDLRDLTTLELLLYRAAENLVSYGNHKDMFLYDILLGTEKLIRERPLKVKELLRSIAPYVYQIEKLTDGDETGSFIYDFSSQLAIVDAPALHSFYLSSLQSRDYYLSEKLFADIITELDFSNPMSKAVAATAVGKIPYGSLERIAAQNQDAMEVLTDVQANLGKIDYGRETDSHVNTSNDHRGEASNNYGEIIPSRLSGHLERIQGDATFWRHDRSVFILNWAKHWFRMADLNQHEITAGLKTVIQAQFEELDHSVLDYIYPFIRNVDREFAFQCICWAQSNSGSWASDYLSSPDEARERWSKVVSDYPSRVDEFFNTSVINSGRRYGKRGKSNYTFSAPKAIQFFIDSGKVEKSEEIAGYYIDLLPSLFPNLDLPEPEFYLKSIEIDPFRLLLKRFEWISPIVKERAAKQLVTILSKDSTGQYHRHFFHWLRAQVLESKACEGLIILQLSVRRADSCSPRFIKKENLAGLTDLRCTAINLIIGAIADELGISFRFPRFEYHVVLYRGASKSKEEFEELVGENLPLIYVDYMRELREQSSVEVWRWWNSLFDDCCAEHKLEYSRADKRYGYDVHNIMICRTTVFAEVLRSTFFRLLDYLFSELAISKSDLFTYTIANFTIEPSVWSIVLNSKPAWWPKIDSPVKLKYNQQPPELDLDIEKLLSTGDQRQLMTLNATIPQAGNFYHSEYFYGLEILPFAVSGEFKKKFDASVVFHDLSWNAGMWYPSVDNFRNFGTFSNELEFLAPRAAGYLGKNRIVPLIAPVRGLTSNIFQYYRELHPTRLLTPDIEGSLKLAIDDGQLQYFESDLSVGTYSIFLDGLRDSSDIPELLPVGSFMVLSKAYLLEYLERKGMKLAFVVKKKLFTKERYRGSKTFDTKEDFIFVDFSGDQSLERLINA
ncbi:ATP-binding protein [Dyadobacter sp. 22481]